MNTIQALVKTLRWEAEGAVSVELHPADGGDFPPFSPGSHIDMHLSNGLRRSYSLCNSSNERHRYVVGVLKDRTSRGGSRWVHEDLRVGTQLTISAPRNNFPMHEAAEHSVLVAGGIGITPLLCMARRLRDLGRSFELHYFARSRGSAAFLEVLRDLHVPMTLHFSDEHGSAPDLGRLLAEKARTSGLHLYACGPATMLDAFLNHCDALGLENAHIERFAAEERQMTADSSGSFTVRLARSQRTLTVTPEKSILDTLLAAGLDVVHSCCEGICGACETRVLDGEPDHRDSVLSKAEREANDRMLICCSRAKTGSITLDL